jgi:hypothetical protein
MMGYYGFLDRAPLGRDEGDPAPNADTPPRRVPRRERDESAAGVSVTGAAAHDHPDHPFGCDASGSVADR